jgi:aminopeptidase N
MNRMFQSLLVLTVITAALPAAGFGLAHDIDISIFPPDRSLLAIDSIRIEPGDFPSGEARFLINRNLTVEDIRIDSAPAHWYSEEDVDPVLFISDPDSDDIDLINGAKGVFVVLDGSREKGQPIIVTVKYSGVVYDSLEAPSRAYAKGFDTTKGLIEERGVFLSNQTLWYPFAFDHMFTFALRADVPYDWMSVSQGTMVDEYVAEIRAEPRVVTVWEEADPTPELYLVAGKYFRHEDHLGRTRLMTYTFEESDSLARVYLDATKRYVSMYSDLIGEYPYGKFALVENFWQTGYGMPSFTLLGSQVIRLPFIVHTSYGHEILHNWWGNSVYVDYSSGNWCEGLTTYGADYFYKELSGEAAARDYRHETLMAYSNSVTGEKDFPLSEFRERHSAASQSVGYGKSLMVFHMLRRSLGDSVFRDALRDFYRKARFTMATWGDIQAAFSETAGTNLAWYFDQWVTRPGRPVVKLEGGGYREECGAFTVDFALSQEAPAFVIDLPIRVMTAGGAETRTVRLAGLDSSYTIETDRQPMSLAVDPDYDTFRMLYLEEIPVTLGTLFGRDSVTVVVGNRETESARKWFGRIAEAWGLGGMVTDEADYDTTRTAEECLWLMGRGDLSDRFLAEVNAGGVSDGTVRLGNTDFRVTDGTLVLTVRNPMNESLAVGLFLSGDTASGAALATRIPHYSKYSYLGFAGGEAVLRGTWETGKSPLYRDLVRR